MIDQSPPQQLCMRSLIEAQPEIRNKSSSKLRKHTAPRTVLCFWNLIQEPVFSFEICQKKLLHKGHVPKHVCSDFHVDLLKEKYLFPDETNPVVEPWESAF